MIRLKPTYWIGLFIGVSATSLLAQHLPADVPADPDQVAGVALYQQMCGACHGAAGGGGPGGAIDLSRSAIAMTGDQGETLREYFIGSFRNSLRALDPVTGETVWHHDYLELYGIHAGYLGALAFHAFNNVAFAVDQSTYVMQARAEGRFGDFPFQMLSHGYQWQIGGDGSGLRDTGSMQDGVWTEVTEALSDSAPPREIARFSVTLIGTTDWPSGGTLEADAPASRD